MKIQYGKQLISEADIDAVCTSLKSDWLTMGPKVAEFEALIAELSQFQHAIAVNSGTAALHTAYHAAGIGPGDEVIMPPLTFVATASMAIQLGADVVFADVCPDTGNLDPQSAEALITSKTKAIIAVDYAGHPCDYAQLRSLCNKYKLIFIVDSAHSLNSTVDGLAVGAFADLATFSFFPTKNITTGEGGAIVTNNKTFAERARLFRSHGLVETSTEVSLREPWLREVRELGMNYRIPDFLCALGISQISRVDKFKARRQEVFNYYKRHLSSEFITHPVVRDGAEPMWHLFPLRVPAKRRLALYNYLRSKGILAQVNYVPVYRHPALMHLRHYESTCPNAEAYYSQEISLPMHAGLKDDELNYVVESITAFFAKDKNE